MDPIRPIGPRAGDELRVIPVVPARIRQRDARERGRSDRERNRARRGQNPQPTDTPGRVDTQA
jgi:hypothetical protein